MEKVIDFYEKFKCLEKGEFFDYPIEDAIIQAYEISEEELIPFMTPEYFDKPWTYVLNKIMEVRTNRV